MKRTPIFFIIAFALFALAIMPSARTEVTPAKNPTLKNAAPAVFQPAPFVPPTVSQTSPLNNAQFIAGSTIRLSANAADSDGTISKVEFYQGAVKLATDTSTPYDFDWTDVPAGNYVLTAVATDNQSQVTTSAQINIVVLGQVKQYVGWSLISNGTDLGNGSVRKTSTGTWDFLAVPAQKLLPGDGYFESTSASFNQSIAIDAADGQSRYILIGTGGWAGIYENGVEIASTCCRPPSETIPVHLTGDRYRLEISNGKLLYVRYRAGQRTVMFTSNAALPAYPFSFSLHGSPQNSDWLNSVLAQLTRKTTWSLISNGIDLGNGSVRKTSTGTWDFLAVPAQKLLPGDGYFESTSASFNQSIAIDAADGQSRYILIGTGGWAGIYENGTEIASTCCRAPSETIPAHLTGDRYRLEISNGKLLYVRYRAGLRTLLFTSNAALPAYPFSFSLHGSPQNSEWQNSVLAQLGQNATFSAVTNGIDLGNGSVRKTSAGTWDFSAVARQQLVFGSGYFESTASYYNQSIALNATNGQYRYILIGTGSWAGIYEDGVEVAATCCHVPSETIAPHIPGDRYRLEVTRGKLRYVRYRSGVRSVMFTSPNPLPPYPFVFTFAMSFQNSEWQNTILSDNVPEHNDAAFVSQTVPATMVPGQNYNVSVTMRNTGASTWTPDGDYQLGSENLSDNTRWGMSRVNLTSIVPPGADATFNFTVTAPAAGSHSFQWRMVQENVQRFGALTTNVNVQTVNNPPTVSLTGPAQNATFTAPATVPFTATASDSDGTITKVEFFQGSTKVGEDTTSPYTFNWTNVAAGSYVLSAKATDNSGAVTTSSTVNITVNPPNQPPTVSLSSPSNGAVFSAPANITLAADAADADGIVTKVQFFRGGTTLIGEDTSAPFAFAWNNVAAGTYSLTAKSFDNAGATTTSAAITITVNALPSVSLTAPTAGQIFPAPGNITLTASASDSDGNISKVQFFSGTTLLNEDTSSPYSFNWTNVAAGNYSLTAKAVDNLGGTTPSTAVSITVNILPTVSITSPTHPTTFAAPASFNINASAADTDGSITKIEFFDGGTLLNQDTTPPYSFTYSNVSSGTHVLTAKATDNLGGTMTSSPVTAIVTNAPTTSITSPANNASFIAGSNITINANASDSDGTVAKVEFLKNGVVLGEDTTSPFSFVWNNVPAGTYSLTTRATDNLGVTGNSSAITVNVVSSSLVSRLDPGNRTGGGGENPLSRNYNWSVPLIGLPGRADLNLNLSLSYNSLVWTKSGSFVTFNDDAGFPSPGFRLGFPVIQGPFLNSEANKNSYLLITPDGSRVELRQVGSPTSTLFESVDSSHLLLNTSTMVLRTISGTQLSYVLYGGEFKCTQIKDRNGNFITANYFSDGRINTVIDTLGRTITFNYDAIDFTLTSITQSWAGQQNPHVWASFTYTNTTVQTNFANGITKLGPANGDSVKTLRSVTLNDGARFDFDYTTWIQISKINQYAEDGHLRNYRSYNLPPNSSTQVDDCPRFSERRDWAENFNRGGSPGAAGLPSGAEQEILTGTWSVQTGASWTLPDGVTNQSGTVVQMTQVDGTYDKIYFAGTAGTATGWKRGLVSMIETYGKTTPDQPTPIKQRSKVSTWTQDDENVAYLLNPRVKETHAYDYDGTGQIKNHARTRTTFVVLNFGDGTSASLPEDLYEYQGDASTVLRRTHTDYQTPAGAYITARVVALPSESRMYEFNPTSGTETLMSRVAFAYDGSGSILNETPSSTQRDNVNYGTGFVTGRGNLSSVTRYNVSSGASTVTSAKYNATGSLRKQTDALGHEVTINYTDSFSDGVTRTTLAYPTSITDADNFTATTQYNFDIGRVTRTQTPPPASQTVGPIKKFTYDSKARLEKIAFEITGNTDYSHTRFEYPTSQSRVNTYTTIEAGQGEALTYKLFDGHGREIAAVAPHPGSSGGFTGKLTLYDALGRIIKQSNPTETNTTGSYLQWQATGDDGPQNGGSGWVYTSQTYDWRDRPLITTNTDGSTRSASYDGCGCAGGDSVTLTSEGTLADGTTKRRQEKIYRDVLGRDVKSELYNWDGAGLNGTNGTVYSTIVNKYNARNQITRSRKFEGSPADPDAASCQSDSIRLGTDNTWKQTRTQTSGWWNLGFDDSSWSPSVDEGAYNTSPWGAGSMPTDTPARWIWYYDSRSGSGDNSLVYFRKGFVATSTSATFTIRADNIYVAYLNGVQIVEGNQSQQTKSVNLTLTPGSNYVLGVEVLNTGGPGGLIVDLKSLGTACEQGTMTYDGYGRLKTRHESGQALTAATTFNYNDDDKLTSVVDGRGATTNYSYANNSRHLVTGITYDVPVGSGITDPSDVSFGYDGAGNRSSMTDSLGTMSYQYDQLSRLTSETRTFSDPVTPFLSGSYQLSYQYNLANQPKKITDHTNSTINYNYDQVGRLSGITGENTLYAGVSTYASATSYRAWGALKGVTFGNNYTTAIKYNARLQGTEFEVSGRPAQLGSSTVMKTQYSYYDDGTLKFAQDTTDERFDRAYSYDSSNRLKEAYSGSEARDYRDGTSSGTATGPYRQSYQYDVYDHITQRTNRFWSQTDSFNTSYANNRRQDPAFQYDDDGNLTKDSNLNYTYDAAGRNITTFDFVGTGSRTSTLSYDGDGQQLKKRIVEGSVTTVTYYVRSSVLGGRVVTELNGQGQKQKGFVFAGKQVIAHQENNTVKWQHVNPVTGSSGESEANGNYTITNEPDPMGVNVGTEDPFSGQLMEGFEPTRERPMMFPLSDDGGGCSFTNPNCTTCTLDGFSIGCDRAMHLVDIGAADILVTLSDGRRVAVQAPDGCPLGICRIWVPGRSGNSSMQIDDSGEIPRITTNNSTPGHWEFFTVDIPEQGGTGPTQNPPGTGTGKESQTLNDAIDRAKARLKGDCAKLFGNLNASDYLANHVSISDTNPSGQPFPNQLTIATTRSNSDSNGNRVASGETVFNVNSAFFTGKIGNRNFPGTVVTEQSSMYGLTLEEIQELTILHELFHIADTAGEFNDNTGNGQQDLQRTKAINKLLRDNCDFPVVAPDNFGRNF